jgi:DNA-binding winged helix-turn-helix (wHTH) protein
MIVRLHGRRVPITPQEFLLLTLLMENAGRVITRSELLDRIWGPGRGRDSNTLAVFTSRLRRKLRRPDGSARIRTVRGVGYVFDESADGQGLTPGNHRASHGVPVLEEASPAHSRAETLMSLPCIAMPEDSPGDCHP